MIGCHDRLMDPLSSSLLLPSGPFIGGLAARYGQITQEISCDSSSGSTNEDDCLSAFPWASTYFAVGMIPLLLIFYLGAPDSSEDYWAAVRGEHYQPLKGAEEEEERTSGSSSGNDRQSDAKSEV